MQSTKPCRTSIAIKYGRLIVAASIGMSGPAWLLGGANTSKLCRTFIALKLEPAECHERGGKRTVRLLHCKTTRLTIPFQSVGRNNTFILSSVESSKAPSASSGMGRRRTTRPLQGSIDR